MSLRIRRGVEADRQTKTFDLAEPVYITDTKEFYIGDGETPGGKRIVSSLSAESDPRLGADLDLNGNNIVGTGNINIDGTITATGNINLGDGAEDNIIVGGQISSSLVPDADSAYNLGDNSRYWQTGYFEGLVVDGAITSQSVSTSAIYASDSSLLWDGDTDTLNVSNLQISSLITSNISSQNTTLEIGNSLVPELDNAIALGTTTNRWAEANIEILSSENIFAGNRIESGNVITSPIFLGDLEGSIIGEDSTILVDSSSGTITTDNLLTNSNTFNFNSTNPGEVELFVNSDENRSVVKLSRTSSSSLTPENDTAYGSILFERQDINGTRTTAVIAGTDSSILLVPDSTGNFTDDKNFLKFTTDGYLGIGTQSPSATLDVRGEIVSNSYVQFGSFTTTERDSLTAANGMVIYNTTDNKFQGYQNGAWINLDNGLTA